MQLQWPDGAFVSYAYDAAGETTLVRENGGTSGLAILGSYTYDDLGRRTGLFRGNGLHHLCLRRRFESQSGGAGLPGRRV